MPKSQTIDLAVIPNSPDCDEAVILFKELDHLPTRVCLLPADAKEVVLLPFIRDLSGRKYFGLDEVRLFIQRHTSEPVL